MKRALMMLLQSRLGAGAAALLGSAPAKVVGGLAALVLPGVLRLTAGVLSPP